MATDWLGRPSCGPGSGNFGAAPAQPDTGPVFVLAPGGGIINGQHTYEFDTNACYFRTPGNAQATVTVYFTDLTVRDVKFQVTHYFTLDGGPAVGPEFLISSAVTYGAQTFPLPGVPTDCMPSCPIRVSISFNADAPVDTDNMGISIEIPGGGCAESRGPNDGVDAPCADVQQSFTMDSTNLLVGGNAVLTWTISNPGGPTVVPVPIEISPPDGATWLLYGGAASGSSGSTANFGHETGQVTDNLMFAAGGFMIYVFHVHYPSPGTFSTVGTIQGDHSLDVQSPTVTVAAPTESVEVSIVASAYNLLTGDTALYTILVQNNGNVAWRYQVVFDSPDANSVVLGNRSVSATGPVTGQTTGSGPIFDYLIATPGSSVEYLVAATFNQPGHFVGKVFVNGHEYDSPGIDVPPRRPQNTLHATGYEFNWTLPPGAVLEYLDVECTVVWDAISANGDQNPPIHMGVQLQDETRLPGAHPHSDFGLENSDSVGAGATGLHHTLRYRVYAADIPLYYQQYKYLYMVLASRRNIGDKWRILDRRVTARWCLPAVCLDRDDYQGPVQIFSSRFVACPIQRRIVGKWSNPYGYDRVAPYITLYAGTKQLENFEIRFWPNPFDTECPASYQELAQQFCRTPCFVIRVPCLPAGATLRIDGAKRRCDIRYPGSTTWAPADEALEGFDAPFVWDEFDCIPLCFAAGADYGTVSDSASIRIGFQGLSRVG